MLSGCSTGAQIGSKMDAKDSPGRRACVTFMPMSIRRQPPGTRHGGQFKSKSAADMPADSQPMINQRPGPETTYAFYDETVRADMAAAARARLPGSRVRVGGYLAAFDPATGARVDPFMSRQARLTPVRGWEFRVYKSDNQDMTGPPDAVYQVLAPAAGKLDDWDWGGIDDALGQDFAQRIQELATMPQQPMEAATSDRPCSWCGQPAVMNTWGPCALFACGEHKNGLIRVAQEDEAEERALRDLSRA